MEMVPAARAAFADMLTQAPAELTLRGPPKPGSAAGTLPPSRVALEPGSGARPGGCGCQSAEGCSCRRKPANRRPARPSAVPGLHPAAAEVVAHPGEPLPAPVRTRFETAFAADLSDVRLHRDATAARASDALDAEAWTAGRHVGVAAGRYSPGTPAGDRLLGHELVHVLQNRAGAPAGTGDLHRAGDAAEAEADRLAGAALAGGGGPARPVERPAAAVARQGRGHGRGVTRVDVNCADMTIHFDGPRAHSWQLSSCDLTPGDYDATVQMNVRTTTFRLMLQNVPEGTRFSFEYRIMRGDPDPMEMLRVGQSVRVHATAAPASPAAGGTGGAAAGPDVRVSVRRLTAAEFTAMTGMSPDVLLEGHLTPASSLLSEPPAAPLGGLSTAGLGPAALGAWAGTPTPMSFVPPNSTFLLWTEGHMSLGANVNGSLTVRGYRGDLAWYTGEMVPGVGPWFTRQLLTGVPGGWRNDILFPSFAGRAGSPQTVIYLPTNEAGAQAFADSVNQFEAGGEYRYSQPRPPGTPGARPRETSLYEELYGTRGEPVVVRCTNNCITVPASLAERAIGARPTVTVGGERLDIPTGTFGPSGRVDPFEAGRAARMRDFMRAPEGLPAGAVRLGMTAGAMRGMAFVRVGGVIGLVYGAYHTEEHLRETYGTPEFPAAVGEETGGWAGGLLGSALGSAAGAALVCAPAGPVDAVCVLGGFLGGLLLGALFGTAGAVGGHAVGETLGNLGNVNLGEAAVQMFGSDEDRRRYYEDQRLLQEAGF